MPNVRFQIRKPIPVTITAGRFMSFDGDMWCVPKRALLRPLVAATEAGRLKVAKGLREAKGFETIDCGFHAANAPGCCCSALTCSGVI
jgi:hypothetical protein